MGNPSRPSMLISYWQESSQTRHARRCLHKTQGTTRKKPCNRCAVAKIRCDLARPKCGACQTRDTTCDFEGPDTPESLVTDEVSSEKHSTPNGHHDSGNRPDLNQRGCCSLTSVVESSSMTTGVRRDLLLRRGTLCILWSEC